MEAVELYNIGFPIFQKFFEMPKPELLKVLREICGDNVSPETLEDSSSVRKEIIDDVPNSLKVCSWDTLEISPFGIHFRSEHGNSKKIVEFNKFFKLD